MKSEIVHGIIATALRQTDYGDTEIFKNVVLISSPYVIFNVLLIICSNGMEKKKI